MTLIIVLGLSWIVGFTVLTIASIIMKELIKVITVYDVVFILIFSVLGPFLLLEGVHPLVDRYIEWAEDIPFMRKVIYKVK